MLGRCGSKDRNKQRCGGSGEKVGLLTGGELEWLKWEESLLYTKHWYSKDCSLSHLVLVFASLTIQA
jgi:hypothetical protein